MSEIDIAYRTGIDCELPKWPFAPLGTFLLTISGRLIRFRGKTDARVLAGQATATFVRNNVRRGCTPMRRAGQKGIGTTTSVTPPTSDRPRAGVVPQPDTHRAATSVA